MFSKLFQLKGKGFILRFVGKLAKELLTALPLPLFHKLADGKLTAREIQELVVLVAGEAAEVFEEEYRKQYGEPVEDEE